jgi:long-chain acyl-CoA synthetase
MMEQRLATFFQDKKILLTGSTGFVGKVVLATLLGKFPEVGRIVCLVRAPNDTAAEDRFLKDVIASAALDPVRDRYGIALRDFVRSKVEVRAGDVARERLGIDEARWRELARDLDLVVHCAGLVDFVPPLDKGLAANVDGTQRVLELAKQAGKGRCAFLHVSTCFVAGEREGHIREELRPGETPLSHRSGFAGFDHKKEIEEARKLVQRLLVDELEDPAVLAEYWDEAEGNPRKAKRLAEVRSRRRLAEEGYARARKWGWANTYCYTKALAERLVDAARPELGPVSIVRPAIVESAVRYPIPGWNQGVNTCAPLMWMCSRGMRYFPIPDEHVLDVIPVDLCVNNMVQVAAALLAQQKAPGALPWHPIYQVGTSAANPLALRRVMELTTLSYRHADLPESIFKKFMRKHSGAVNVPRGTYERFGLPGLTRVAKAVRNLVERIPQPRSRPALREMLEAALRATKNAERQLEHGSQVVELFLPFIHGPDFTFRTDNALALHKALAPADQELVPYEPAKIDWRDYFLNTFIPGLERWTFPELKEREGSATETAPLYTSLTALIEDAAGRYGKRVALRRVPPGDEPVGGGSPAEEKLTYDELLARTESIAARLGALGVQPADRVLLVGENRPLWVAAYFGILRAGATAVPVDAGLDGARLVPLVKASRSKVVLHSASKKEALAALQGRSEARLVALEEIGAPPRAGERAPDNLAAALSRPAPASLIYTSGTTGAPKGVLISHKAFAHQVQSLSSLYPLAAEDRVLSVLPLHHAFEFTCGLLLPIARGATIAYAREPSAEAIKHGLAKIRPTRMIGVPALFEAWHRQIKRAVKARGPAAERAFEALIAVHRGFRKRTGLNLGSRMFPEVHGQFGGELAYAVCGGAALAREVTTTFHGLGIDLYEGYGLTEAAPVVCTNRPSSGPKGGVVGEPIPGVEVRIHEPDGEGVGELLVKTPSVMDGYDGDARATATVLADGWLRTGDLARVDANGRVAIVGRSKDVIVDGAGNTVYPDEVEELYSGCPDVAELAVAGVPLRDGKESVGALVLIREQAPGGASEARERVRAFFKEVANGLPNAKRVKILRFATRALPRTATRKVKREEVSRILQDLARGETASGAQSRRAVSTKGVVARTLEEVAGLEAETLQPESDLAQDCGLDSIAIADVIQALVDATGRPAPVELGRIQTVADLVRHFEDAPGRSADAAATPLTADARPVILPRVVRAAGSEAVDAFVRLSFARGFETKVVGTGNIPRHTQAIVIANHASHLDAPLVRYALGGWGKSLIAVGARDYFFKDRLTATYFENFTNVVAFDRTESIRESLGRVVELLEAGHNVLIFPEGTRSLTGRLQAFKAGLGYLVATSGVGVLPVYLSGTYHAAPKGALLPRARKLEARIGGYMAAETLLQKAGGGLRREKLQRVAEIARDAIVALRDGVAFDVRSLPDPREGVGEETRADSRRERARRRSPAAEHAEPGHANGNGDEEPTQAPVVPADTRHPPRS